MLWKISYKHWKGNGKDSKEWRFNGYNIKVRQKNNESDYKRKRPDRLLVFDLGVGPLRLLRECHSHSLSSWVLCGNVDALVWEGREWWEWECEMVCDVGWLGGVLLHGFIMVQLGIN